MERGAACFRRRRVEWNMYFFNKKIKILRGFALVCVLALGLCLTGGLQIAEAKTTTYYDASAGRLHVKGTKLVDKKGHEVQLRGVSTHGLSWYRSTSMTSVLPSCMINGEQMSCAWRCIPKSITDTAAEMQRTAVT